MDLDQVISLLTKAFAIVLLGTVAKAHPHSGVQQHAFVEIHEDVVMLRLTIAPSKASSGRVVELIDTNADGNFSASELQTFAHVVLSQVSVRSSGLELEIASVTGAAELTDWFSEGYGQIELHAQAVLPEGQTLQDNIDFSVNYGALSHSWKMHPFFVEPLLSDEHTIKLERRETGFFIDFSAN